MLRQVTWNVVAKLGASGFETSQAAGVITSLLIHTDLPPCDENQLVGLDAAATRTPAEKASTAYSRCV